MASISENSVGHIGKGALPGIFPNAGGCWVVFAQHSLSRNSSAVDGYILPQVVEFRTAMMGCEK